MIKIEHQHKEHLILDNAAKLLIKQKQQET